MELRHMRYFVAVAEELHFGRAAARLGISQPPLSQQIRALEKQMGVALFDRTKHAVRLTRAGEAVLAEAYRLLEQAERVRTIAARAQEGITASVNVGCLSSVFFTVLPQIVSELRSSHPHVDVTLHDVETTTGLEALLQGRLDVAIIRPEQVPAPLRGHAFLGDRMVVAVHEAHPLARRRRVPLRLLAGEPLVAFARRNLPRRYDTIIAACLKEGFSPNVAYHCGSIQAQLGCVACGLGIAIIPGLVREWKVPGVAYRELDPGIMLADLALVWNPGTASDAVRHFVEAGMRAFSASRPAGKAQGFAVEATAEAGRTP